MGKRKEGKRALPIKSNSVPVFKRQSEGSP